MQKYITLLGWFGLAFGIITAVASFLPGYGAFIGMGCMFPGFLFSSLYVLLLSKYEIVAPKFNPGYIGLLLSSTPILLFIYFYATL